MSEQKSKPDYEITFNSDGTATVFARVGEGVLDYGANAQEFLLAESEARALSTIIDAFFVTSKHVNDVVEQD